MPDETYSVDELADNPSFRRWVFGTATDAERVHWDGWIEAEASHRDAARAAQMRLVGFSLAPPRAVDPQSEWKRLHSRLTHERRPLPRRTRPSSEIMRERGPQRRAMSGWSSRIAGALAILLAVGSAWYLFDLRERQQTIDDSHSAGALIRNEVETAYGERKTLRLSDGSTIVLNAASRLVHETDPADPLAVRITLDGEALFSVTKRTRAEATPFSVHTSDGTVRVLGTEFVVSTRDAATQVVLKEGRVGITTRAVIPGDSVVLHPGQLARFGETDDTVAIWRVNTAPYTSWATNTLVFDETPLGEVLARIEHTFGVDVVVRNPALYERAISGSVENTGLDVMTSALARILDTDIAVRERTMYVGAQPNE